MDKEKEYKILLIEPSEIVAAGLSDIISRIPNFSIVQTLSNLGYYNPAASNNIDIIIVDPSVIDYNERFDIRSYFNNDSITIIALMLGNHEESVIRQYDGCIGIYDNTQRVAQKLRSAIEEAAQTPRSDINELSSRERDILAAVAKGMTNKEIADEFNISVYTVISHRRNISQKLGINSIPGLTVYAIMNKLVDMSDFT